MTIERLKEDLRIKLGLEIRRHGESDHESMQGDPNYLIGYHAGRRDTYAEILEWLDMPSWDEGEENGDI